MLSPGLAAGTAGQRIVLCGPRTAIVTGNPYNFVVRESSFITLAGFTVTGGTKGEQGRAEERETARTCRGRAVMEAAFHRKSGRGEWRS